MHKGLIAFIVVAAIALSAFTVVFMQRSAKETQRRSEKILEDFRTVDRDLKKTIIIIDSANNFLYDPVVPKINK